MLELLLELRLLLLLLLLVAANDVDTANAQATKAVSAGTINFFMMWSTPSKFDSGLGSSSFVQYELKRQVASATRHVD